MTAIPMCTCGEVQELTKGNHYILTKENGKLVIKEHIVLTEEQVGFNKIMERILGVRKKEGR